MDVSSPLAAAARRLRSRIARVAGTGDGSDWLSQVEAGDWDGKLLPDAADALRERLLVAGEHLRYARALAGGAQQAGQPGLAQPYAGSGFRSAAGQRLPLNRKERYYTGTVLPARIASDGLLHLPRFLRLCDLDVATVDDGSGKLDGSQDVQVFTEYSFAESILPSERHRFAGAPLQGDTPDLVLSGPDWLLAVEAKVFHRPTVAALDAQMTRQANLVQYWTRLFRLDPARVRHVLLVPEQLLRGRRQLAWQVVTWQQVRDSYDIVGDGYWLGVLRAALDRYDELASPEPTFGANADGRLTGEQIAARSAEGAAAYEWVGRAGGLNGTAFAADRADGSWRTRAYEMRREAPPTSNTNWFTISDFVSAVVDPASPAPGTPPASNPNSGASE